MSVDIRENEVIDASGGGVVGRRIGRREGLCVELIQLLVARFTDPRGNDLTTLFCLEKLGANYCPPYLQHAVAKEIHTTSSHQGHAPRHRCCASRVSGRLTKRGYRYIYS
jgi:hypothetical protein